MSKNNFSIGGTLQEQIICLFISLLYFYKIAILKIHGSFLVETIISNF